MLEKHEHNHPIRDFDGIADNRAQIIPWYFTALFYGLLIWGIGYMGYFLFSGWSQEAEFEQRMVAYETEYRQETATPATAAAPAPEASREEMLARGAEPVGKRVVRACQGGVYRGEGRSQGAVPDGRQGDAVSR